MLVYRFTYNRNKVVPDVTSNYTFFHMLFQTFFKLANFNLKKETLCSPFCFTVCENSWSREFLGLRILMTHLSLNRWFQCTLANLRIRAAASYNLLPQLHFIVNKLKIESLFLFKYFSPVLKFHVQYLAKGAYLVPAKRTFIWN